MKWNVMYTNKRASNNTSCDRIIATATTVVVDDDSNNDIVVEKKRRFEPTSHTQSSEMCSLAYFHSVRHEKCKCVLNEFTFNIVDMQITWCECQPTNAEKTFKSPQISLKIWLTSLIRYTLGLYRFNVYRHYVIALIL